MSVRVVQLSASSDVEREYIESRTVYRSDPSLEPGETRTVRGHDGVRVRRYDVSYVNGEEAGRTLIEEYYDPEPADTVVYYPTQYGTRRRGARGQRHRRQDAARLRHLVLPRQQRPRVQRPGVRAHGDGRAS